MPVHCKDMTYFCLLGAHQDRISCLPSPCLCHICPARHRRLLKHKGGCTSYVHRTPGYEPPMRWRWIPTPRARSAPRPPPRGRTRPAPRSLVQDTNSKQICSNLLLGGDRESLLGGDREALLRGGDLDVRLLGGLPLRAGDLRQGVGSQSIDARC